jgi:hypothetical protein
MSRIHAPHVKGHFRRRRIGHLLCAAVYLGTFENRLMNASKLADYVGCHARPWISILALIGSRTKLTQHWADRIDNWLDPKKVMPIKPGAQA